MTEYSTFAERERDGWSNETIAESFHLYFSPLADKAARRMVELADPGHGQEVLDLCCGQGSMTRMLRATGAHVAALDFSEVMLAAARRAAPRAEFHKGDAQHLPFDAGRFDAVLCSLGLPHLPDQPKALSEIARVLHPGGKFLMSVWVGPEASPAFAAITEAISEHAEPGLIPSQPDLNRFARDEDARALLEAAGLRHVGTERIEAALDLAAPEDLYACFARGTVSVSMQLRDQPRERIAAIRNAVAQSVERQPEDGGRWRVSMPLAVIRAEKPA